MPGFALSRWLYVGIVPWMPTKMRKTPSYLKGLAETRARAAGDVARYKALLADITSSLAEAEGLLESCDRLIKKFDIRLNPGLIAPINAWKGRYGPRGALLDAIALYLQSVAPAAVTISELAWHMQLKFNLNFCDSKQTSTWINNSLRPRLRDLLKGGVVERLHDSSPGQNQLGRWRWVAKGCQSMEELRALADAKDVGVAQAPAIDEDRQDWCQSEGQEAVDDNLPV